MQFDSQYTEKPATYFSGARRAFVDSLPNNPQARLLELGCGTGDTSAYALSERKCGWCAGIELCAGPAEQAQGKLNQVLVGDIEEITLEFPPEHFDILLMSEVVEHLRQPWMVLRKLHRFLKPSAIVISGSPNVSHFSMLFRLLHGDWPYEASGLMDQTHLRWFTPLSYKRLFNECGYSVISVEPALPLRFKAQLFNVVTFRRFQHLLHSQMILRAQRE